MYVAYTTPGAERIAGVQGRYFLPLMFPLYLCFSGNRAGPGREVHGGKEAEEVRAAGTSAGPALLESRASLWYYLWELVLWGVLTLTVWFAVICRFCM